MTKAQLKEQGLYREILRGAFEFAWHRRILWPLGLLAAILMVNGGAAEFIIRSVVKIASGAPFSGAVAYIQAAVEAAANGDAVTRISIFFSAALVLTVAALLAVLAIASSGGLFHAVSRRVVGRHAGLRESLAAGLRRLGPLFLTQVAGRSVIFCLFVIVAAAAYASGAIGMAVFVVLFVVFAAATLFISFLMMMTNAGVMIGGERWLDAAHDAIRFFRRHWLISLEMIVILLGVSLAAAAAAAIAVIILVAPFTLLFLSISVLKIPLLSAAIYALFQLIALLIVFAAAAALAAFEHAAWALLYVRLVDRGFAAKLERLWHAIRSFRSHVRLGKRQAAR